MSGELTKMKIIAYSDPEFNTKVDEGEFTTLVNPESYIFNYKIEVQEEQAPGTSASAIKFNKAKPEVLDFEFIFDSTGIIQGSSSTENGVIDDVEKLKKVALKYEGENHKPNYLRISWGTLLFKGCLTEMTITFKLFRSDGTPIRATAKGKFKGFVEDNLRVAKENAQSPDLTHTYLVNEGDTLPWICQKIYGDPKYYLAVAEFNKLKHFRRLQTGEKLRLPPVDKTVTR
jgi:LysM repeat protein